MFNNHGFSRERRTDYQDSSAILTPPKKRPLDRLIGNRSIIGRITKNPLLEDFVAYDDSLYLGTSSVPSMYSFVIMDGGNN